MVLVHFARFVMAPMLRHLAGGPAAQAFWREQLPLRRERFAQRGWYRLRCLLGEIDAAAFAAQPHHSHVHPPAGDLPLLDALRAEFAGRAGSARDRYLAYDRQPYDHRDWVGAHFARWRAQALAR